MRTAILFPGQGSQTARMRELVEAASPDLLELALAEVGEDPFDRVEVGTRFAQPALYCASIALWTRAGRPPADFVAGHSLGEVAALAAAGSLDPEARRRYPPSRASPRSHSTTFAGASSMPWCARCAGGRRCSRFATRAPGGTSRPGRARFSRDWSGARCPRPKRGPSRTWRWPVPELASSPVAERAPALP